MRPEIGGALIRGEKGTAKSTAVRGLAALLSVATGSTETGLVELPLGATEDRVVGSLDLQRVMRDGEHAFSPGLLARAHGGVLYVDEVNLLHDHLVDILLDAAAMGRVHVERDGISHSHEARFVLIGTMNPEEGEPRPTPPGGRADRRPGHRRAGPVGPQPNRGCRAGRRGRGRGGGGLRNVVCTAGFGSATGSSAGCAGGSVGAVARGLSSACRAWRGLTMDR